MYIIGQGETHLPGVTVNAQDLIILKDSDTFSDLSMITGARHSVITVAYAYTSVRQ